MKGFLHSSFLTRLTENNIPGKDTQKGFENVLKEIDYEKKDWN